jgi:hypothetical protein
MYTSIPPKTHIPYFWRSRPFSRLFVIAKDANMYTYISQGPENDISESGSSPYRKKIFDCSLNNASQKCGKKVFDTGMAYRPET